MDAENRIGGIEQIVANLFDCSNDNIRCIQLPIPDMMLARYLIDSRHPINRKDIKDLIREDYSQSSNGFSSDDDVSRSALDSGKSIAAKRYAGLIKHADNIDLIRHAKNKRDLKAIVVIDDIESRLNDPYLKELRTTDIDATAKQMLKYKDELESLKDERKKITSIDKINWDDRSNENIVRINDMASNLREQDYSQLSANPRYFAEVKGIRSKRRKFSRSATNFKNSILDEIRPESEGLNFDISSYSNPHDAEKDSEIKLVRGKRLLERTHALQFRNHGIEDKMRVIESAVPIIQRSKTLSNAIDSAMRLVDHNMKKIWPMTPYHKRQLLLAQTVGSYDLSGNPFYDIDIKYQTFRQKYSRLSKLASKQPINIKRYAIAATAAFGIAAFTYAYDDISKNASALLDGVSNRASIGYHGMKTAGIELVIGAKESLMKIEPKRYENEPYWNDIKREMMPRSQRELIAKVEQTVEEYRLRYDKIIHTANNTKTPEELDVVMDKLDRIRDEMIAYSKDPMYIKYKELKR